MQEGGGDHSTPGGRVDAMTPQDAAKRAEEIAEVILDGLDQDDLNWGGSVANGAQRIQDYVDAAVAEAVKEHHCWYCKWRN